MIGVLVLSQRKNAMNSRPYGPASHGNRGDLHLQAPILIDVTLGTRLVTIATDASEMCSAILKKLGMGENLKLYYALFSGKPLQWERRFADYDVPERFTIEVVPTIRGGGN